jgi:hypothetical protein
MCDTLVAQVRRTHSAPIGKAAFLPACDEPAWWCKLRIVVWRGLSMDVTDRDEQGAEALTEIHRNAISEGLEAAAFREPQSAATFCGESGSTKTSQELSPASTDGAPIRQIFRYHPVIGYVYFPRAHINSWRRPDGKNMEFLVNSAGVRSDREYSVQKPADVYRILVFGESQAAGVYQTNDRRFSDLMEQRNPGLEVINLAIPGTGTDQQLLTFEQIGCKYEHDLVILVPYLMTIRRNVARSLPRQNPETGRIAYVPKPWFELSTGEDGSEVLELRNVPVPAEHWRTNPQPDQVADQIARRVRQAGKRRSLIRVAKKAILPLLGRLRCDPFPLLKRLGYDPYPEYQSPDTEEWRLMAAIIRRFAREASPKPFVIAPLVSSPYMQFSLGRSYWQRFSSLVDGKRVFLIDLLPHFRRLGREAVRCFFEDDSHLSDFGHSVLADAVEAELRRLELLPVPSRASRAVDQPEPNGAAESRNRS